MIADHWSQEPPFHTVILQQVGQVEWTVAKISDCLLNLTYLFCTAQYESGFQLAPAEERERES